MKTQMRLVEREEDRLITFSKRKAGINKKATELSVMCGAQVAIILFSPKGNAFAYGHPDLKYVVNKFLGREEYPINGDPRFIELVNEHRRESNEGLIEYHNMLQYLVNQFVQHKEFMKQMAASRRDRKGWWDAKVEDMKNVQQVEALCKNIVVFQEVLCHHMEKLQLIHQANLPSTSQAAAFQDAHFPPNVAIVNPAGAPMTGLGGDSGGEFSGVKGGGGSSNCDGHF
ncbi:unnamed protein product [Rhodiola kirilowii]